MKSTELLKKLDKINKSFYTIGDLEKITGQSRNFLYVSLNRWVKTGIIKRVARGIYVPFGKDIPILEIASAIYPPNYLSFESALSRYGVLNLVPYTLTFATTRKTRNYIISDTEVVFRKIKKELFFGYEERGGIYVAFPEKALIDQVYLFMKGMASLNIDEVDLSKLKREELNKYMAPFPKNVGEFIKKLET